MTDRGRQARWSIAAALAPAAAAVFAATTAWSTGHPPVKATGATTDTAAADAVAADLQGSLDEETARVAALQARVDALRKQASGIGRGSGSGSSSAAGPVSSAGSSARTRTSTASGVRSRSTGSAPSRTRKTSRAPAVHAVTGGS
jgi:hypothetical protein